MAQQRRRPQPQRGDLGAVTAARQQAQMTQAQKDELARMATVSIVEEVQMQDGVFDPVSGSLINGAPEVPPAPEPTPVGPQPTVRAEVVPEVVDEVQVVKGTQGAKRVVRIAEDVEMMTYGAGNHYTFEAGKQYLLPNDVADHVEELGLAYH